MDTSAAAQAIKIYGMPAKIWCSIDIEYTCQERPRLLALDILRRISDRSENEILELKLGGVLNV